MTLMFFAFSPNASGEAPGSNAPENGNSTAVSASRADAAGKNQLKARKTIEKQEAIEGEIKHEKPPDPCETFIEKAHRYYREKRYPQAVRFYEEALKIRPAATDLQLNLASALIATEQYSKAYSLLEELKRLQPDHPDVLFNLAIVTLYLGRPAGSLSLLEEVERLKPAARFEVCLHRAVAYRMIPDFDHALNWYQQAYSLNPTHPPLLFNMALAYDSLQLFPEAVHFYGLYLKHAGDLDLVEKKQVEKRMHYLEAYMNTVSSGLAPSP